ncbi:OmpP1/FadL family transporter [Amaricoccus sp. W119]|uniref:OmpP1/FadL family transporter n=1 Tax=Amaricoccus sp. W119 TaxID=3391833 RepID=UPI0039A75030
MARTDRQPRWIATRAPIFATTTATFAATFALGAALAPGAAHAGAIERAVPAPSRILFEEGRYAEVGLSFTDPDQSGGDANLAALGGPDAIIPGNTGDLFEDHWSYSAAFKDQITDRWSYVLAFDQPYGADTQYGAGSFPAGVFSYDGTNADLNTYQLSAIVAYDATPNIKVFGGARAQRLDASAAIPFIGPPTLPGYTVDADADWGYGYLLGAAYHIPEIALRVALTYHSKIGHSLDTSEFDSIAIPGVQDGGTTTDIDTPQSVALEFQTGVMANTLVFGSIRWVDWSEFSIAPPTYTALTGRDLVDYSEDWWTYNLGAAYQFTDDLAASFSVTWEPSVGGELTTLGPSDGRTTANVGVSYDYGKANFAGGVSYGTLGDTTNVLGTDFNDGSVWAAGLRIGYSF